jgi:hypothetical protein
MKFDREATEELLAIRDSGDYERAFK